MLVLTSARSWKCVCFSRRRNVKLAQKLFVFHLSVFRSAQIEAMQEREGPKGHASNPCTKTPLCKDMHQRFLRRMTSSPSNKSFQLAPDSACQFQAGCPLLKVPGRHFLYDNLSVRIIFLNTNSEMASLAIAVTDCGIGEEAMQGFLKGTRKESNALGRISSLLSVRGGGLRFLSGSPPLLLLDSRRCQDSQRAHFHCPPTSPLAA